MLAGVSAGVIGTRCRAAHRPAQPRGAASSSTRTARSWSAAGSTRCCPASARCSTRLDQHPDEVGRAAAHRLVAAAPSGRCWCALSPQRDDGRTLGYIVTFDDITALLSRAAPGGLGRGRAADRARGQEPADPDPALGRAAGAQIPAADRARTATAFTKSIATIVRQVDTIGRLISEFSAFARMPAPVMREESVAELVRDARVPAAVGLAADQLHGRAAAGRPVRLLCDGPKVSQALTNLLQNGINALSEAGARPRRGSDHRRACAAATRAVLIEVEDNGPGFPAGPRAPVRALRHHARPREPAWALPSSRRSWRNTAASVELLAGEAGGALVRLDFPARAS